MTSYNPPRMTTVATALLSGGFITTADLAANRAAWVKSRDQRHLALKGWAVGRLIAGRGLTLPMAWSKHHAEAFDQAVEATGVCPFRLADGLAVLYAAGLRTDSNGVWGPQMQDLAHFLRKGGQASLKVLKLMVRDRARTVATLAENRRRNIKDGTWLPIFMLSHWGKDHLWQLGRDAIKTIASADRSLRGLLLRAAASGVRSGRDLGRLATLKASTLISVLTAIKGSEAKGRALWVICEAQIASGIHPKAPGWAHWAEAKGWTPKDAGLLADGAALAQVFNNSREGGHLRRTLWSAAKHLKGHTLRAFAAALAWAGQKAAHSFEVALEAGVITAEGGCPEIERLYTPLIGTRPIPVKRDKYLPVLANALFAINSGNTRPMDELMRVARSWDALVRMGFDVKGPELYVRAHAAIEALAYQDVQDIPFALAAAANKVATSDYNEHEARWLAQQARAARTPRVLADAESFAQGPLSFEVLPQGSVEALFAGKQVGCCMHPDNEGSECAWHGTFSPNGAMWVVRKGESIVAAAWVWKSGEIFVVDNVEYGVISKTEYAAEAAMMVISAAKQYGQQHGLTVLLGQSYGGETIQELCADKPQVHLDALGVRAPVNYTDATHSWVLHQA